MAGFNHCKILGIKKTPSKDGKRTYVTFACSHGYSDYELDNTDCAGVTVENIQANEDFGIDVGDVVEFRYGKAISLPSGGLYQPIYAVDFISKAKPATK